MPEGHSIRRLADQWQALVQEPLIFSSPQGRFASEAETLQGRKLIATEAHGKHLFLNFGADCYVHVHLGLYGRFTWRFREGEPEPAKDTIRLRTVFANGWIDLSGPTQCELIGTTAKNKIHARLGPDPLHPEATIEPMLEWLSQSKWPVGRTVLDQSKIAGIGNVYRAEILFMLGLNPSTLSKDLSKDEWEELWNLSRVLLTAGVARAGSIITTAKNLPSPATLPPGTHCASRTYVYKRTGEPCVACGAEIVQEEMANRTLYYCPSCQS